MTKVKNTSTGTSDDWLLISTDGFAEQNAGREPGHLVKELVQNSLDAIGDAKGDIHLLLQFMEGYVLVVCTDNGVGIDDLNNLRTMFFTSKHDSHLKRGRLGRGFKEMLCLCNGATVSTRTGSIHFQINGKKRKIIHGNDIFKGTKVEMGMPWPKGTITALEAYFQTFLVPSNITFTVNGHAVKHRKPNHVIDTRLPTESFVNSRWVRPAHDTSIELVPFHGGETESKIYEMGIPVCPAEWDRKYHVNILQRIPMNPNRDAVMTGFPAKLHKACLPVLLEEMKAEEIRQEWVGSVAPDMNENLQKKIISRGFGENIVISVPNMSAARDFDADARELNHEIVKTTHLPRGFREIIRHHVPTSAEAVSEHESSRMRQAAESAFSAADAFAKDDEAAKQQRKLIDKIGRPRVEGVCAFAQWFCNRLLEPDGDLCTGVNLGLLLSNTTMSFGGKQSYATWSENGVLTLGIDSPWIFKSFLQPKGLALLVHEAAHNRSHHHGDDYRESVERLTGIAARVMYENAIHIQQTWGGLDE